VFPSNFYCEAVIVLLFLLTDIDWSQTPVPPAMYRTNVGDS
jgi:hypothetical protein